MSLNFSFLETHFDCDDFVVFLLRISMVFAFVGVYEVFWLIFSNEDLLILYFIVW
jgi:cupin superfamily acireductone dioxygenase involved in methionine salvage